MKLIKINEIKFLKFVTTSLVAMLMISGCGKKSEKKETDTKQNTTSTSESTSTNPAPNPDESPGNTTRVPDEFLVGYVVYHTEQGTHLEGFRLIPRSDGLIGTNDVRISSEDVDSIVVRVQVPGSLTERVGGIQNALLRNGKFEHRVQVSDLSFTVERGVYFVTFTVSGLQYARMPHDTLASLQFTLATIYNKPLKTVQINCSFGLKFPQKRQN